jgi:hypothetical protein
MMPKMLLRGRFGFWIVGKKFMGKRDELTARHFHYLGVNKEQRRIVRLLEVMMNDYEQGSEEFDVLADAVALIQGDDK